jgi:hypothetical protein
MRGKPYDVLLSARREERQRLASLELDGWMESSHSSGGVVGAGLRGFGVSDSGVVGLDPRR